MTRITKIKIPYVKWRNGRPRYSPGQKQREQGYIGTDLRHPENAECKPALLPVGAKHSGEWFTASEAMEWSTAFSQMIKDRQPQKPASPKPTAQTKVRSKGVSKGSYPISRLIEDWRRSPAFKEDLRERSQKDYISKLNVMAEMYPDLWASEVDVLDRVICFAVYDRLRHERGQNMARGVIRVLSSAVTWGLNRGKFKILQANPCLNLGMKATEPRLRFATRPELETLVAVADHVGRQEIGDSFILAVWSGQRQSDRLALELRDRHQSHLSLTQSKTGARVNMPIAPQWEARWNAALDRRKKANVVSNKLVMFEKTWQPWNQSTYQNYFREIRTVATNGLWRTPDGVLRCPVNTPFKYLRNVSSGPICGSCLVEPRRTLHDFQEGDFRDTAVTWMALADATIPQICAVTGHTIQSATQVLRHYLALHPEMAKSAIAKMVAWYDKGGETEI